MASSSDGKKLVALVFDLHIDSYYIYASADYGATWAQTSAPKDFWNSVPRFGGWHEARRWSREWSHDIFRRLWGYLDANQRPAGFLVFCGVVV